MNGLDGIFILTVLLLAFWGFQTGVLGTAIWLIAAYGAVLLGAQLVGRVVPILGLPANFTSIVTTLGYVIVSALVGMLARSVSSSVRAAINVTPLRWVNDIGGALLGAIVGLVLVAALIAAAAAFTYVVPEGAMDFGGVSYSASYSQVYLYDAPRSWLDDQLTSSLVVEILSGLRGVIVPFAPNEIGLAVDVLFSRVD